MTDGAKTMQTARHFLATGLMGLLAATALAPGDAGAQPIYRIIGADGKVTYSDKAPVEAKDGKSGPLTSASRSAGSEISSLPFELRQVAAKYPVTLYTSSNCGPCGSGRALLASRGVPYTEKTVSTTEDLDAYRRLAGTTSLPLLTIGSQQLKGFSDAEWAQYLDAAGYPQKSLLPANFKMASPSPLVVVQQAALPPQEAASAQQQRPLGTAAARAAAAAQQAPEAPAPANPAGIRF